MAELAWFLNTSMLQQASYKRSQQRHPITAPSNSVSHAVCKGRLHAWFSYTWIQRLRGVVRYFCSYCVTINKVRPGTCSCGARGTCCREEVKMTHLKFAFFAFFYSLSLQHLFQTSCMNESWSLFSFISGQNTNNSKTSIASGLSDDSQMMQLAPWLLLATQSTYYTDE